MVRIIQGIQSKLSLNDSDIILQNKKLKVHPFFKPNILFGDINKQIEKIFYNSLFKDFDLNIFLEKFEYFFQNEIYVNSNSLTEFLNSTMFTENKFQFSEDE